MEKPAETLIMREITPKQILELIQALKPALHPDLFTPEEAVRYLRLDPATGPATLHSLRSSRQLIGQKVGAHLMYHRKHLDAFVSQIFKADVMDMRGRWRGPGTVIE